MFRRITLSVVISFLFSFCLYRIVYLHFDKVRITLLQNASGPNVEFSVPEVRNADLLMLEIKNSSDHEISLRLNHDQTVRNVRVHANDTSFVYVTRAKDIRLAGDSGEWRVKRAEIRNLYGSLKGIFNYVILPDDSQAAITPSLLACALLFVVLFASSLALPPGGMAFRSLFLFVTIFFLVVLLIPMFCPYKVLFAAKTFFLFLLVLYLPAIAAAYGTVRRKAETISAEKGVSSLHTAFAVAAVFLFFFFQTLHSLDEFNGNYTGFLQLSQKYTYNSPLLRDRKDVLADLVITKPGYDGQFFYVMAFDPFLQTFSDKPRIYRKVVDNPPYRYGRIGFSLLTTVFSLNQFRYFPNVMIFLLLFSHALGTFSLARIAILYQRSPFWGCLYLLIPAFTISLRLGLPESVAAAFLTTALYYYLRDKIAVSCILFVAAILVRETSALVPLLIAVREMILNRRRRALTVSFCLVPYALWRVFVGWRLFPTFGMNGLLYRSEGLSFPFSGIYDLYTAIHHGEYISDVQTAAVTFPLFLIGLVVFSAFLIVQKPTFLSFALFGYSVLAVTLDYKKVFISTLNAERVTYEAFLVSVILFLSLKHRRIPQLIFLLFFSLLFIYDWNTLTYWMMFRNGFLWQSLVN